MMRKTTEHRMVVRVASHYPHTVGWIVVCVVMLAFLLLTKEVIV